MPSAGIHMQGSDNATIEYNYIYGNTWWTTSATSAIAFAESVGSGTQRVVGNAVYANRNFIPFYMAATVLNSSMVTDTYGTYLQFDIMDGQGIYTTRQPEYSGSYIITNNKVFDNGINGISI